MRMGRNTWIFFFLIFTSFSSHAARYNYTTVTQAGNACTSDEKSGNYPGSFCQYYGQSYYVALVGSIGQIINTYYWSGCPEGQTPDGTGGRCISPAGGKACVGSSPAVSGFGHITNSSGVCVDYVNADLPSQCKSLGGTTGFKQFYVTFDGDGNPQTPPPLAVSGCAAVPGDVSHCTMAPKRVFPTGGSIQPTTNKCKIAVSFTGGVSGDGSVAPPISAGPGDDGLCVGRCPDLPPAPIDNDTQPCTYVLDGEGRKVCSSFNFNYQPGNSSCGTVNGQFQCIGKAPSTNGIVIDTKVTDTVNPDGSIKSVKQDTATVINCVSPKPCVSNTTTNTTTTNYNSNGAKTGQSTSCTGPACSTDGKGDEDGDGLSDCAVGQCSDDQGVSVGAQDWHEKGDETFATVFEGFTSRVSSAPVMKAGDKFFAFNPSGSCPVWSVDTWVFSVTLDQHCSTDIPWEVIKAIIMACAGFVAFRWALL